MDKIIVYINDAAHALEKMAPMNSPADTLGTAQASTTWILVACPPLLSRHASKWLTRRAREAWRADWSDRLFGQVVPTLRNASGSVQTLVAQTPLVYMTTRLLREHGPARVMDARLTLFGQDLMPVTENQPVGKISRWTVPGALVGMGTVMALASE